MQILIYEISRSNLEALKKKSKSDDFDGNNKEKKMQPDKRDDELKESYCQNTI